MIVHGGAPECRVSQKVNDNRFLEEENLTFIWYGVVGAAEVDADVVKLLS
jgi:hypothetical protein